MSKVAILVVALVSVSVGGRAASSERKMATIQSCRYRSGQTAHFIVSPDGRNLVTVRTKSGSNDVSEIINDNGHTSIETNGGVEKQEAIERLSVYLQKLPRKFVSKGLLPVALRARPKYICPGEFPFSPE